MSYIKAIANDKNVIAFRPEIKRYVKNTNATILLQQIMYWYDINEGEFYKFIEPCKHEKYRDGDSWCEELAFSRKEFVNAMNILKDLELVTSKTTRNRVTYYTINSDKLEEVFEGIYLSAKRDLPKCQKGFSKSTKGDLVYSKTMLPTETTTETTTLKAKKQNKTSFPTDDKELHEYAILKAAEKGINCPVSTYEEFKDHHRANGSKFVDWSSAFNTWTSNFFKFESDNRAEVLSINGKEVVRATYNYSEAVLNVENSNRSISFSKSRFFELLHDGKITSVGKVK